MDAAEHRGVYSREQAGSGSDLVHLEPGSVAVHTSPPPPRVTVLTARSSSLNRLGLNGDLFSSSPAADLQPHTDLLWRLLTETPSAGGPLSWDGCSIRSCPSPDWNYVTVEFESCDQIFLRGGGVGPLTAAGSRRRMTLYSLRMCLCSPSPSSSSSHLPPMRPQRFLHHS